MSQDVARILLLTITAIGAVAWLAGLAALVSASRSDLAGVGEEDSRIALDDPLGPRSGPVVAGSAEVEGDPATLSARAAAVLARRGSTGMLKILERTDHRLEFEGTGLFPALGLGCRSRVVFDFQGVGRGRTRVSYRARLARGRALIWAGAAFQVAGLAGLVGGYWAMNRYVVPSPNLGIRAQVVQMVQVVHVLWPPFLLAYLHRRPKVMLRGQLDALAHNIPYLDADHADLDPLGHP